ncbi:MAG: hypothetical protein QXR30_00260 [Candidatus Woesearchaeota archaeon]
MWGLFKRDSDEKIKESFKKVKDDMNKLDLKINAILYEHNFFKKSINATSEKLSNLIQHYSEAITKYNQMHSTHHTNISQLNKEIESLREEVVNLKNTMNLYVEKLVDVVKFELKLKEDIEKLIKLNSQLDEIIDKKINEKLSAYIEEEKTTISDADNVNLSVPEQQIVSFLLQLSNEYGQYIPVSALLDEVYKGDKRKASTLSTYLSSLERKGIIRRERRGRLSFIIFNQENSNNK